MRRFANNSFKIAMGFALCLGTSFAQAEGAVNGGETIRKISILAGSTLELEISASGPLKPKAQAIHGPDRLILDFPGALPGKGLRNLDINRGDVKDARVGLFSSHPPVTRIVLDLKSAQPYQLFPSGNTVVVKFGAAIAAGGALNSVTVSRKPVSHDSPETIVSIERPTNRGIVSSGRVQAAGQIPAATPAVSPVAGQVPRMHVSFENGLLSISSNRASLSEVLTEVHRRTGAEIAIPPGAESEEVFTNLGPGAPKEVLASLLNGSRFNFIVVGSERDPGGIRRVVLTPKEGGAPEAVVYPCGSTQPSVAQTAPEAGPPQQAFGTPMPEEANPGDSQNQPPPQ